MHKLVSRILVGASVVLLVVLQYRFWLGEHGWVKLKDVRRAIHGQEQENAGLSIRNQRLHAEVIDLKKGTDALEERARSNLGLVKKGETYYQVIEEHDSSSH